MAILTEILGGNLGKLFKDVVGTFKLDPAKKAEMEQALNDNAHEIQMKEYELTVKSMEAETKIAEIAGQNIRAESQSGDKYTSRARPTYMYVFYLILGFNYVVLPVAQMIGGVGLTNLKPIEFPQIMWEVFVAGYLGYVGVRGYEKIKGAGK